MIWPSIKLINTNIIIVYSYIPKGGRLSGVPLNMPDRWHNACARLDAYNIQKVIKQKIELPMLIMCK